MNTQHESPIRAIRMPDALWEAIKEWAREDQRTIGAQIRVVLAQAIRERAAERERAKTDVTPPVAA